MTSSPVNSTSSKHRCGSPVPRAAGLVEGILLLAGLLIMFTPTVHDLATKIWVRDEQGHGPIILVVAGWLFWNKRAALQALQAKPDLAAGWGFFVLAALLYVLGRSQAILMFEAGAFIPLLIAFILLFSGRQALRLCWFPLFFLLFMVPLPATLVVSVTTPLKSAVSAVAGSLMYALGYPIGRSGVILTVGPYQLLVADACAGLNSMFTLEALGLLYMNLMRYKSAVHNITLALLIIPISFVANIIRVVILVLVTYHFGDEAGQGFVHGFAGMVLFLVALTLILLVDHVLRWGASLLGPAR